MPLGISMTVLRSILTLIAALSLTVSSSGLSRHNFPRLSNQHVKAWEKTNRTLSAVNEDEASVSQDHISPYWGDAIGQWEHWILYWAQERELDPDLVAAVIRKESIGQAKVEGPYGSVGLMMVMPAEASGMSWRPTAQELKQPGINLRWGTGILKEIIREADGNLPVALAAYNGGWDQIYLHSTERYAHSVLTYYAYAIAGHHGYSYQQSKVWTMVIMTRVDGHIKSIYNDTSGHFLAPCFDGAVSFRNLYPEMVNAPRTRVAHYVDKDGHDVQIDAWLLVGGLDRHVDEKVIGTALPTLPHLGHRP